MKVLIYASALVLVGSCSNLSRKEKVQAIVDNIEISQPDQLIQYSNTITSRELKEQLYLFASDEFNGR